MSHVVVIDSAARRAVIKTTPSKHLSDVLQEACSKLGYNAAHYGLKNNKKTLDLSLTYRLSGLASGAKLELILLSRSPSVVSVALQLPESEARGAPNGRLTDKFPSTTTLWLVLRKFEAAVAGEATVKRNLTARGSPSLSGGQAGSGRLFYETPVINVVGRELSSFVDLQKTLGQLGFNSGNTLLRLSFRKTDKPLEEAMVEIEEYFKSVESQDTPATDFTSSEPTADLETPQIAAEVNDIQLDGTPTTETPSDPMAVDPPQETEALEADPVSTTTTISSDTSNSAIHQITVFAPSASSTPSAARHVVNEKEYIPSVDQIKQHQSSLQTSGRPQRLATDAELEATAQATEEKLASIKSVTIRVRFPDEHQVQQAFTNEDTAETLYDFVKSCLDQPTAEFQLLHFTHGAKGALTPIPRSQKRLIQDLKLRGRVMVNFSWAETAPLAIRTARHLLKPELRQKAQEIKVEHEQASNDEGPTEGRNSTGAADLRKQMGGEGKKEDKENKLRKLLKFGKK